MKAYARSIFHLFDGKRRYVVPLFQRQYVWNREKQWEPLWEDISRVAERRWENETGPPHFLGAMVLDQIRTYGNQVPAHLIIDGQQRLTTFQIILAALRIGNHRVRLEKLSVTWGHQSPGVRLEKLRFGVIHKKVGPVKWGMRLPVDRDCGMWI